MRPACLAATIAGLLAALGGACWAADLPGETPSVAVFNPAPAFSWTGFYVGGHLGGGMADWSANTSFRAVQPGTRLSHRGRFAGPNTDESGVMGGAHAGYLWQTDAFVLGAEADVSGLDLAARQRFRLPARALAAKNLGAITAPVNGFASVWEREADWLATARGRVGFAVDRMLFYATGGLAVADASGTVRYTSLIERGDTKSARVASRRESAEVGFTVGGGFEAAVTDAFSVKLEYAYIDLGSWDRSLGTYIQTQCCRQTVSAQEKVELHTFRVGLSHKFSSN